VWLDAFVEPLECAAIVEELHWAWWWPSTLHTANGDPAGFHSTRRRSETTTQWWFSTSLLRTIEAIEARMHARLGVEPECLERWQALRYPLGGRFDPHLDAGLFTGHASGDRVLTALVYLDRPGAGGDTVFPFLDLTVSPEPGRLLVWANLLGDGSIDRTMQHASVPVERGGKTVLVTWARERPVRSGAEMSG
jgi:prolyl 4-hydroxylase